MVATSTNTGGVTALLKYGPFGEPNTTAGFRFRYTGQQLIGGLGLYYYKARFYSPALGRFLQTDPIGYGDGLNLYGYVGNDPVNLTDPTGNCPMCIGAATSVVMGGVIRGLTGGDVFDPKAIALDATLGAVGTGLASKAVNLVSLARAGTTNIERNVARGALGESMLGISPTGKQAINVGGRTFFPDRLTSSTLDEVKNVVQLSAKDARQITAEASYAAQNGLDMTLWARQGADLSRVQNLISNGSIAVRDIPGIGTNGFRILTNGESGALGAGIGGGRSALK